MLALKEDVRGEKPEHRRRALALFPDRQECRRNAPTLA